MRMPLPKIITAERRQFLAQVAEYDHVADEWIVDEVIPSTVTIKLDQLAQHRWLSIMLAIKELMAEHNIKCGRYDLNSKGDIITILGVCFI